MSVPLPKSRILPGIANLDPTLAGQRIDVLLGIISRVVDESGEVPDTRRPDREQYPCTGNGNEFHPKEILEFPAHRGRLTGWPVRHGRNLSQDGDKRRREGRAHSPMNSRYRIQ